MRVRIDDDACSGDGSCVEICPQIFRLMGDVAVVRMELVPLEFEHLCREAAESCPSDAIIIDE